ncbi:FAD-dependent monooxygenase [Mycolicibacterium litorale]|nr:FAD-dependent monooxygenase [Mycolicibacterium litorale]MCV7416171.1 FAD-dependent monooxygenase [Mycolicibacterium litorale]TDY09422.1 2-polyprenyl-6-methoxyphenol hydroxylase-like FAD-dependent oxidoreductase [Mycolicibacterium litorale]
MSETPVVISGAGPTGLMVACELALAGVRPVVLERLPAPSDEPKANGLIGQVVRMLDMRGLYEAFSGAAEPPKPMDQWMFSGLRVPLTGMRDNPMYALMIQQPRLVRLLADHARELGVDVRWGHELTGVRTTPDGVAVTASTAEGDVALDAAYLVGADGGRSGVRKLAGIGFPGHTSNTVARLAHVEISDEIRSDDGGLDVPGIGRLPWGHHRLDDGGFIFAELEPGRPMVGTIEFGGEIDDAHPMTLDELRHSTRRVLGAELPFGPPAGDGPHALRRIAGQNTRQADRYRAGNVFLVGDSAHVHSAMGGPGLNLGLQDAMNLGWKLAAAVSGWAPANLLDTYHDERHPAGLRVMMHSMSQTALFGPGPEVGALRGLFAELLQLPSAAAHVAHLLAGSDVRYDTGDDHPLSGRLVPEWTLADGRRVAELLHAGRPVLLDGSGGAAARVAGAWAQRIDCVEATVAAGPVATLIRPDGYIVWATDGFDGDGDGLSAALRRWFGTGG